jgi:chemotaxis protein methyltransferase CheR
VKLSRTTFDELRRLIHQLCGLVLAEDKSYLIRYRLEALVRASGCRNFDEFIARLRGRDGSDLHDPLIEAITTAETSFFRDLHPFETFRREILPVLGETAQARRVAGVGPVRIWCAAAATGQEPYSLAMLVHDYIQANRAPGAHEGDFQILATDVSAKVLATAAAAEYSEWEVTRGLTPVQVSRHFEQRGERWVVRAPVRRLVEFRRLNLLQPLTGLGTFDMIVCRNVLIYFDEATRRRLCEQFSTMLTNDGWLLLGSAESLYGITTLFESARLGETLMYRKAPGRQGAAPC